jgi:hypothetical protein
MDEQVNRPQAPVWTSPDSEVTRSARVAWAAQNWRAVAVVWFARLLGRLLGRHWRGLGFLVVASCAGVVWGKWAVIALVALVVAWKLWPDSADGKPVRLDERVLPAALVTARILPAPADGKMHRLIRYHGKPTTSPHGTSAVIGLPDARTLGDVLTRRVALASALGVPENRLHIFQDPDDPANVIRLHVATPPKGDILPPVADAVRTDWRSPVAIGYNSRGQVIEVETFQHNSLFAGQPGMGKTATGRTVIGHFLLDPVTTVKILDGKGAVDDYRDCRDMCSTFISGTSDDAVPATIAMLTEVLGEVRRRNSVGGWHDGMLVVLEELQDVRAACSSREQLDRLDTVLGRIIRQGRAVGVVLLILTQKPSGEDVSTGVRSQVTQRLALKLRTDDYRLALGDRPTVPTPRKPGMAVWTNGDEHELVTLYHLDSASWARLCKRAAKLRTVSPPATDTREFPALDGDRSHPAAVDPLVEAVCQVLAESDPRGITPTEIHNRLPAQLKAACPTVQLLGLSLARHPELVERVTLGTVRVWRLRSGASAAAS